ncbi:MAG: hypothetical protein FJ320_02915 [SAR202 cluster bacterium]|nr:hypothetical protein [SAR202 cluster bacterium]
MKSLHLVLVLAVLATLALLTPSPATHAQEHTAIQAQVANGTAGATPPDGLQVTLHIFDTAGGVQTLRSTTNPQGLSAFDNVPIEAGKVYALSTEYLGVTYSHRFDPSQGNLNPTLQVFETTRDLSSITFDSYLWYLRNIDGAKREINAIEIVSFTNRLNRTFVPNISQPSAMNLLRFSFPPHAQALQVDSDLPQGNVINVGTGFGLNSPIPPGEYQIAFAYQLPYEGEGFSVSKNLLQGASAFRVLLPQGAGVVSSPGLQETQRAVIGDAIYRVWEARDLGSRSTLSIDFSGLPQPSLWQRIQQGFTEGSYAYIAIPSFLGLGILALLAYALLRQQPQPAIADSRQLLQEIAHLDDLYDSQALEEAQYRRRRAHLKHRLASLMQSQESGIHGTTPGNG